MNRYRVPIIAAVVVVFIAVGGYLIYANQPKGGPQSVMLNVTVTGGKSMTPSTWTAHKNDTVTVNMTSDTSGEVHLHGYDIPFETEAGTAITKTFKADNTGDFPIEWEETSTPLGHLVVS